MGQGVSYNGRLRLNTEDCELHRGQNRITLRGRLDKPSLWWTNGIGIPHLYDYRACVKTVAGSKDEYSTKIGVRALEIVRERDELGTSLYVRLNGVPVFMKGANYIPQDNFQNRVTRARYEQIIGAAAEVNMNMLRVWGGGIYEEDIFYDTCDRYGILVWQDMQFACAMYPADDAFLENVRQEVIDNVTRLRNHPCIALYCGNNENAYCWHEVWKNLFPPEIQAAHERDLQALYEETIPQALREADPTRYYHPSSPTAGFDGISPAEGDTHYWAVWHGHKPFETYAENLSRFVSEYGFQSYPELATVRRFARPEDRELHSAVMLSHQRCTAEERKDLEYGSRLIQSYMDRWYRQPKDFAAYLYLSQVMQADGVRLGMEAHRRGMPFCMGSLYWQIDDCWPVASWSSIDYFGRWKALHYAARQSFAPVLISPVLKEDEIEIHVVSDHLHNIQADLEVVVFDFNGTEASRSNRRLTVPANASKLQLGLSKKQIIAGRDETGLAMLCRLADSGQIIAENLSCFRLPKDLKLSRPAIEMQIAEAEAGYWLELSAKSFAKSVVLSCGDAPGFFSDNYFDLLPGGRKRVHYRTELGEAALRAELKVISLFESANYGAS